ncbi:MAG: hypothetical protein AAF590_07580 [Pseudomonadota bacterium]
MPLQNRVDPFSRMHAVSACGLFTGNRGILHDPATKTLKHQRWATEGWVICTLEPLPGREKRPNLMLPSQWTELFFLDEAVGLAAGHRPCHACRRERAIAFRDALGVDRISKVNPRITGEMKGYLRARSPLPRPTCDPRALPDGAFFAVGRNAYLKWRDAAYRFEFEDYDAPQKLPENGLRLTPEATCDALRAGYMPILHPSISNTSSTHGFE